MNTPQLRQAVVIGGNRIPFARAGGAYHGVSNLDMLTAALEGLVARFGLQGERLGAVAAGAVLKHSRDFNLTREAVQGSSLSPTTPAYDVQMACATGMEAVWGVANKIALGQTEVAVAGGVDSVSDSPMVVTDNLRAALMRANYARSLPERLKAFASIRPGDLKPVAPMTDEPRTGLSMGESQAITTAQWHISRQAQDELALASHLHLAAAYESGFFDDLITGFRGLTRDANMRADSSLEKLAKLQPVFGKRLTEAPATMTAGNSTPLTDGAALALIASPQWAQARHMPVLARVVDAEAAAVDYVHGRDGLLMAPVYAVPRLLARNGLTLGDFDIVEIHEAFAATVLCQLAAWRDADFCRERLGLDGAFGEIDPAKLNPLGSSLATGHPFAATGARLVATAAKQLNQRGGGRALISVCAAGGQGVAMILEA